MSRESRPAGIMRARGQGPAGAVGPLPHPETDRSGRHGGGVPRQVDGRGGHREASRAQARAAELRPEREVHHDVRRRGEGRDAPQPSEHRPGVRLRAVAGGVPAGDGAGGRARPGPAGGRRSSARGEDPRGLGGLPGDGGRQGARLRPQAQGRLGDADGDRPSGREPPERPADLRGRGEGGRLRHRQGADGQRGDRGHQGQVRLHVAGAGPGRKGRPPERCLFAGGALRRAAHGPADVSRAAGARCARGGAARPADPPRGGGPDHPQGPRPDRAPGDRARPRGALPDRPLARFGAGPVPPQRRPGLGCPGPRAVHRRDRAAGGDQPRGTPPGSLPGRRGDSRIPARLGASRAAAGSGRGRPLPGRCLPPQRRGRGRRRSGEGAGRHRLQERLGPLLARWAGQGALPLHRGPRQGLGERPARGGAHRQRLGRGPRRPERRYAHPHLGLLRPEPGHGHHGSRRERTALAVLACRRRPGGRRGAGRRRRCRRRLGRRGGLSARAAGLRLRAGDPRGGRAHRER